VTGTGDLGNDSADNQQTGTKEPQTLPAGSVTKLAWLAATEEAGARERPVDFIASTLPTARQRDFSTLEIVSLSVGISFGLSLLAIWLVVIGLRQFLPDANLFPRNGTSNHHGRQSDFAPVCPNTGPAVLTNRPATAQQRETHVVDLAQDSLALAPIASEYQHRRRVEQQCRNEQQTAILERIYQDNVALQRPPRQPVSVQTAPC
jgi:hypothetical protein